eukprot:scaffold4300_cov93-Skeletonema_marinoi.AAC.4
MDENIPKTVRHSCGQANRYGVTDLTILTCNIPLKRIPFGKGLECCSLSNSDQSVFRVVEGRACRSA